MSRKDSIVILCFLLFVFPRVLHGQTIDVGVFRENTLQRIDFSYENAEYLIETNSGIIGTLLPGETVSFSREKNSVIISKNYISLGLFSWVKLLPTKKNSSLRLQPKSPVVPQRKYRDAFSVFVRNNSLSIVNQVSYTNYLAGVIQSEGGNNKAFEYYKAQAVISRTYALRHLDRHTKDGFNLCDQVHCQVYKNQLIGAEEIKKAVLKTDKIYMVYGTSNEIVEAYFHANCGGETSSSDYVWRENIPYLQPVKDTFCTSSSHSSWEVKIPESKWRDFLVNKYFYPVEDTLYKQAMYHFQQNERKALFISPHLGIPLRDLRYHFRLKSTFFSCHLKDGNVVVQGKGFGHGVGLCQEGAMKMADFGLNYQQILSFYYTGISFKKYFDDAFFNQSTGDTVDF